MCRTLNRWVVVLVSLAAVEIVGETDLAVTTANTIFLELGPGLQNIEVPPLSP